MNWFEYESEKGEFTNFLLSTTIRYYIWLVYMYMSAWEMTSSGGVLDEQSVDILIQ